jgi:hypothetical protein
MPAVIRYLRVMVLFTLAAAVTSQAQTLSGHWCGVGEQDNPGAEKSYWSAHLTLSGAEGFMEYPSLDCGGTLTFERAEAGVHYYRERITFGRDRCLDGGLVAIEQVGTSVRWEWTGIDPSANVDIKATAVLRPTCQDRPGNAGPDGKTLRRSRVG